MNCKESYRAENNDAKEIVYIDGLDNLSPGDQFDRECSIFMEPEKKGFRASR